MAGNKEAFEAYVKQCPPDYIKEALEKAKVIIDKAKAKAAQPKVRSIGMGVTMTLGGAITGISPIFFSTEQECIQTLETKGSLKLQEILGTFSGQDFYKQLRVNSVVFRISSSKNWELYYIGCGYDSAGDPNIDVQGEVMNVDFHALLREAQAYAGSKSQK